MNFIFQKISVLLLLFSVVASCNNPEKKYQSGIDFKSKTFQDKLIDVNKQYIKRESDEIDQYIAHNNWQMLTTGTGLRYMIMKHGNGVQAASKQTAIVNYKISLLDGTVCYSSAESGPKQFIIEQDNVESGLHEGIQYLHQGDKALFILPSYLAHGLVGDESKIPPQASVVYEIELVTLK